MSVRNYAILYPTRRRVSSRGVTLGGGSVLTATEQHDHEGLEHTNRSGAMLIRHQITPTQLAANTDNWNPTGLATANVIRASTDASRNLTGIVAPASGYQALVLINIGVENLVLVHDATSTAANRFYCPDATNLTVGAKGAVVLTYDGTLARWVVIGGGGGGGASLAIEESDGTSIEATADKLIFDEGVATSLGSGDVRIRGLPAGTIGAHAVYSGAAQSIPNATFTAIAFAGADAYDSDGYHDPASNNTRLTVPGGLAGQYIAIGHGEWAETNATGTRILTIFKNGVDTAYGWVRQAPSAAGGIGQVAVIVLNLVAGDYIELRCYQDSGAARTIGGNERTNLQMYKLDSGRVGTGIGTRVYRTTNQTPITAATEIAFDAEVRDDYGFHSTSANTERLTVPAGLSGWYAVSAWVYVNGIAATTNYIHARIRRNGGSFNIGSDRRARSADDNTLLTINTIAYLNAGDYITLSVESDDVSFTVLASGTAPDTVPSLSIMRLDSLPPAAQGSWQDYTPALTNGSVGNGTLLGKWKYIDAKTIAVSLSWVFGSTSAISGTLGIGLPPGITSAASRLQAVSGFIRDSGTTWYMAAGRVAGSATSIGIVIGGPVAASANAVSTTVPMTWAVNDELALEGILEIA